MKRLLALNMFICVAALSANAQESSINTGLGLGFQVSQYQSDFGIGVNVTTPSFVNDKVAARLKGNFMFNETVLNSNTTWVPYSNVSLGLIGVGGIVGQNIRLYGEGGFVGLLPSRDFSSESFVFGGYGTFGFEFFAGSNRNYFIEIGAVGTGAVEDKIASQPIYSNGLLISTGFRLCLK